MASTEDTADGSSEIDSMEKEKAKPVLHTTDATAMLKLRAELLQKSSIAKRVSSSGRPAEFLHSTRNNILRGPKRDADRVSSEKNERRQRAHECREEIARRREMDQKRQAIMEEKSRVYERMSRGEVPVNDDGREAEFLVNFYEKKNEIEEASRGDDHEQGDRKERSPSPRPHIERYVPNEERRVYGASHVVFSSDEDKRQKEMESLLSLSSETVSSREQTSKKVKEAEAKMSKRMAELRDQFGLPEEEIPTTSNPVEEVPLESISLPPEQPPEKRSRRTYGVREWDIGKEQQMRYMDNRRNERDEDFRPPESYYR